MSEKKKPFRIRHSEVLAAQLLMSLNEKDGIETDEFTKWVAQGAPPEKAPAVPLKGPLP